MGNQQFKRRSTPEYAKTQPLCSDGLRETIRAIVREELRKLLPPLQPEVDSITEIVREEVRQLLGVSEALQPQPQTMSYAAAA